MQVKASLDLGVGLDLCSLLNTMSESRSFANDCFQCMYLGYCTIQRFSVFFFQYQALKYATEPSNQAFYTEKVLTNHSLRSVSPVCIHHIAQYITMAVFSNIFALLVFHLKIQPYYIEIIYVYDSIENYNLAVVFNSEAGEQQYILVFSSSLKL